MWSEVMIWIQYNEIKTRFVKLLWPPNKLKGEYKLNHMKMIRGKAFREGRAPSCEANAINATGRNSINNNGKEEWVDERRMVNLKGREPVMLGISSIS